MSNINFIFLFFWVHNIIFSCYLYCFIEISEKLYHTPIYMSCFINIKISDLKFHNTEENFEVDFNEDPFDYPLAQIISFGTVMAFNSEKCIKTDLFVVVSHIENEIKCIFPRMRVDINGNLMLGQDKSIDHLNYKIPRAKKCLCGDPFFTEFMCNNCMAIEILQNADSFMKQECKYRIHTIKLRDIKYIVPVSFDEINYCDSAIFWYNNVQ